MSSMTITPDSRARSLQGARRGSQIVARHRRNEARRWIADLEWLLEQGEAPAQIVARGMGARGEVISAAAVHRRLLRHNRPDLAKRFAQVAWDERSARRGRWAA